MHLVFIDCSMKTLNGNKKIIDKQADKLPYLNGTEVRKGFTGWKKKKKAQD